MNKLTQYSCATLAAACCLAAGGCTRDVVAAKSIEPAEVKVEAAKDPKVVTVEHQEAFQLETATKLRITETLDANGIVTPDVSRTVPVVALSSGRVVDIRARLGDDVKKGQVLLTLASPDMSQAFSDYQKFETSERLAKKQLDRAELLFSKGAAAKKDVEVAQDAFDRAQVDTKTTIDRIHLLGGDIHHQTNIIPVTAPTSGTITEQNVTAAGGVKSLDNSPNLFTIADLSRLWVVCDVYENNLSQVQVGNRAQIELIAYPGRRFEGRVSNISKLLDPTTRSAKVRIELANESGIFRPNMFATVHLITMNPVTKIVIPSTAVLRLQDRDWVFVNLGGKQFRKTEVRAGPVVGDGSQQILSGLTEGDRVVASALTFDREVQKNTP